MWQKLKEIKFERATVTLYRSNVALNEWKVEIVNRTGASHEVKYDEQSEAYLAFYDAVKEELRHDENQWREEIRI